jgi:transposase
MHSDINAALNILVGGMKALGMEAKQSRRIRVLSFLATPSRVKPITPRKRAG